MKEKYFKIVSLFLSFVISIGIGEIALRIIRPERMDVATYEDIYDKTFSPTKNGFIVSLKPNMVRKRWGTEIKTNSYGERDKEYQRQRLKGVYRIAVIGDSVAFGYGIPQEKTFAKVLESKLNKINGAKYEVLLFGRPGYSLSDVYFVYEDKIRSFEPDLVIYAMVLNDFEKHYINENSFNNTTNGKFGSKEILKQLHRKIFSFLRRNSAIYNLIVDVIFKICVKTGIIELNDARALECFYPESKQFKEEWEVSRKWLLLIKDTILKDNKDFIVCLFPYQFQLDEEMLNYYKSKGVALPDSDLLKIQKMIENLCIENNIYFIDISKEYIKNEPKKLYLKNDYGHPNEIGHEVSARAILDYLRGKKLLSF